MAYEIRVDLCYLVFNCIYLFSAFSLNTHIGNIDIEFRKWDLNYVRGI